MKIAAWNVAHQAVARPLHAGLIGAIRALDAQVLVLNEYVHDEGDAGRKVLFAALADTGYGMLELSEQIERNPGGEGGRLKLNNQVLIASRLRMKRGSLRGPRMEESAGETNFLHVVLGNGLEVVGMRVPMYDRRRMELYWEKFGQILDGAANRRIVFLGDLNVKLEAPGKWAAGRLTALRAGGWQVPIAEGEWSFEGGSRIDHTIASPSFPAIRARYVAQVGEVVLARLRGEASSAAAPVSDHAALVVEFTP